MIRYLTAWLCGAAALAAAHAVDAPPPVRAFATPPEFRNPKLSRGGQTLAVTGTREFSDYVALIDLATMQVTPGATFTDVSLVNYWWKGNDWMLFLVEPLRGWRVFRSMDLKTKKIQPLHSFNNRGGSIVNPLVNDPDHVLVSVSTPTGVDLRKLDVRTGKLTVVENNPGFVTRWLTDREGRAVAALGRLDGEWFLLTRDRAGADWKKTLLGKRLRPDFWPMAVFQDQRRLIGWDHVTADTARAVIRDPQTGADEVIFHSPEVDPSYNLSWGDDETRVRAIAYETDRPRFHYLAEADAKLAGMIDAALPDSTNFIVSTSADESRLIIEATSDSHPERYFLLDRKAGRIVPLGAARAELAAARFGAGRYFTFPSRDGLTLSARLLLPAASAAHPPLIVICGSDLTARAYRVFTPFHQLLASRGYAVLEVNHRGVDGFGQKLADLGTESVHDKMPDDVADAVDFAVRQGWADGQRVGIFSQGGGGLVGLYALSRHPEKFKVWLNFGTPMDRAPLSAYDLSFGLTPSAGRHVPVAREDRLRSYVFKLDPLPVAKALTVPSFHFYGSWQMVNDDGAKLKRHLDRGSVPHVFVLGLGSREWGDTVEVVNRQWVEENTRIWTEALAFLAQHLPVPAPGAGAGAP